VAQKLDALSRLEELARELYAPRYQVIDEIKGGNHKITRYYDLTEPPWSEKTLAWRLTRETPRGDQVVMSGFGSHDLREIRQAIKGYRESATQAQGSPKLSVFEIERLSPEKFSALPEADKHRFSEFMKNENTPSPYTVYDYHQEFDRVSDAESPQKTLDTSNVQRNKPRLR
jgi:hypothetical protein